MKILGSRVKKHPWKPEALFESVKACKHTISHGAPSFSESYTARIHHGWPATGAASDSVRRKYQPKGPSAFFFLCKVYCRR